MDDFIDLTLSDAEEQESTSFEPVPAGTYNCTIVDATKKANSKGTGDLVNVEFSLDGGSRKVWNNYNVKHENASTAARGKREFKALIDACGIQLDGTPFSPTQLHGKRCAITVTISPDSKDPTKLWNRVTNPQPIVTANTQPAATPGTRPWEND